MAGFDWKALLQLAAPLASAAAGGQDGGLALAAFERGREAARKEREAKRLEAEEKTGAGAKFKLDMVAKLLELDDPAAFMQMRDAASQAGESMFGMSRTDWEDVRFPEGRATATFRKELDAALETLRRQGHDLDQLAETPSTVTLPNGQSMPVAQALAFSSQPKLKDPTGKPLAAPKKPATGTESERAARLLDAIASAEAAGDTAKAATLKQQYARLLQAKQDFRAPVDQDMAGLNKTLKELQVEAARARLAGGGETQELANELKRMQIAAEQAKLDDAAKADTLKRTAATRLADDLTGVIDELLDPQTGQLTQGAKAIVGMRVPFAAKVPGSPAANADAALNRLTGQLVVELMQEMKAQSRTGATGFGALSERELDLLQGAATKLSNRNMSEPAFAAELKRIRDKVRLVYQNQGAVAATPAAPSGRVYYDQNGNPVQR